MHIHSTDIFKQEVLIHIKIAGGNISNCSYAGDTILMAESEEELKRLLMKMKEESEKVGFRRLRSWHLLPSLHGKQMGKLETVTDFIILGSKIIADGDSSHEIKRRLLFGRKGMTNLDNILKSRGTTLPTKV